MNALPAIALAWLLAGCASPMAATAQSRPEESSVAQPAAAPAAALAGEYRLDGVMETGSGLLLREDGSFEWYFSYGALDLGARGRWVRSGEVVELAVAEMGFPPQMPETKFERLRLRIDGAVLVPSWPWDMDGFRKGGERGRYVREER